MKNFLITFSYCLLFVKSYGQLSQNVNLTYGSSISGVTFGTNSADWIYGLKGLANGETIVTGYSHPSGVGYTHPSAMLVDPSGAKIWEESYTCLYGIGFDVYELPQGFVIIGRGESVAGCSNPSSMFSILVSKTTGLIIPSWGVKYYNDQSIALPPAQNGLSTTNVNENNNGKPRSCEIRNSSNQITGFMICGNYNDNSYPTNANSLPHFTTGCFLLKIDALGRPDPSFGNGGIKTYYQNTISKYLNPHLYNVCVNYDGSGNPQGFVAVGDINENITVLPSPNGSFNRDALLFMTDMSGNITYYDIYDENSHQKWGAALSYPYADNPDNPLCTQMGAYPVQENSNEKATRVRQKVNGGPLIVLNQFDYTFYSVSSCVSTYPNNAFLLPQILL